ncbi:MAG: hypothetical protein ACI9PP_002403 [Halobacteriales archaeon]|jgi:hypothetical protein
MPAGSPVYGRIEGREFTVCAFSEDREPTEFLRV